MALNDNKVEITYSHRWRRSRSRQRGRHRVWHVTWIHPHSDVRHHKYIVVENWIQTMQCVDVCVRRLFDVLRVTHRQDQHTTPLTYHHNRTNSQYYKDIVLNTMISLCYVTQKGGCLRTDIIIVWMSELYALCTCICNVTSTCHKSRRHIPLSTTLCTHVRICRVEQQ